MYQRFGSPVLSFCCLLCRDETERPYGPTDRPAYFSTKRTRRISDAFQPAACSIILLLASCFFLFYMQVTHSNALKNQHAQPPKPSMLKVEYIYRRAEPGARFDSIPSARSLTYSPSTPPLYDTQRTLQLPPSRLSRQDTSIPNRSTDPARRRHCHPIPVVARSNRIERGIYF